MDISFRIESTREIALLGGNEVGAVIRRDWAPKRKAAWISWLPGPKEGIRMISPACVEDVMEARRALIASVRAWLEGSKTP